MASEMISTLVKWGIGLVASILILMIIIGPSGFMKGVAKAALALGEWVMPESNTQENTQVLEKKSMDAQQRFMAEIIKFDDKGNCALQFTNLKDLNEDTIELINYNGNIQSKIGKIAGKEETGRQYFNTMVTEDKKLNLCRINAKAFYNCCLDKKPCCETAYNNIDSAILTKEGLLLDEQEFTMDHGLLFKPAADKICFIPEHSLDLSPGCSASENSIDNDCREKIKSALKLCQ